MFKSRYVSEIEAMTEEMERGETTYRYNRANAETETRKTRRTSLETGIRV